MKKLQDKTLARLIMALFCLLSALATTLFLGGLMFLLSRNFWGSMEAAFFFLSAPFLVAILLLFVTTIPKTEVIQYGCGLYYGTFALSSLMRKLHFHMDEEAHYIVSFIIVSLICYIVYLKRKDTSKK